MLNESALEEPAAKPIGIAVLKSYTSAIMDLWKRQHEVI